MDLRALGDQAWPVLNRLVGVHTRVYRLTGGRIGHRVPGAPPMLLLEHTGARSGKRRVSPLAYVADGVDVVLVASKGGAPRNPAWFHNLMAHPDTTVQIGSERRAVHARAGLRGRAQAAVADGAGDVRGLRGLSGAHGPGDPASVVLEPR